MFEGIADDGNFIGSINIPEGGDQSANLVVSGTSSGVTVQIFSILPDAVESFVQDTRHDGEMHVRFAWRSLLLAHTYAKVIKYLHGLCDALRGAQGLPNSMRGWYLWDINISFQPLTVLSLVKPCFGPRGIDNGKRESWRY